MNSTQLKEATAPYSFSDLREDRNSDKLRRKDDESKGGTVQRIRNSCLKTSEEMEVDFWKEMISLSGGNELRNNRDGYLNTNPERIDSGFMEENY